MTVPTSVHLGLSGAHQTGEYAIDEKIYQYHCIGQRVERSPAVSSKTVLTKIG